MSTDRDVPLIWVCIFSDLVRVWVGNSCSRYMHHLYFLSNGTRMGSHFIRVLLGILEIFKHGSTCMDNDRIQWIIRPSPYRNWVHTISCLSVTCVDFLR